jgi:hypothetical protein
LAEARTSHLRHDRNRIFAEKKTRDIGIVDGDIGNNAAAGIRRIDPPSLKKTA